MNAPAHVLVFDSGVGALSIIAEIKQRLPRCSITFASDSAFFPYGEKDEGVLIERVDSVLKTLHQRYQPNIIVVACNTASTVVLPKIRSHFKIATVGVVPAIRPAAQISKSKVIGLLATPGTVARQYTLDLIKEFAQGCTVISVGSTELVQQAENRLRGQATDSEIFKQVLQQLFDHEKGEEIDTIVLACTHFPLLKQELQNALKPINSNLINWIDSGEAIANRVDYWINQHQLTLSEQPNYRSVFVCKEGVLENSDSNALNSTLNKLLPGPIDKISVPE